MNTTELAKRIITDNPQASSAEIRALIRKKKKISAAGASSALARAKNALGLQPAPKTKIIDIAMDVFKQNLGKSAAIDAVMARTNTTRTQASNALHRARRHLASKASQKIHTSPPRKTISVQSTDATRMAQLEALIYECGLFRAQALLDAIRASKPVMA